MPELAEDIARRVAENEARSVPAEGQTGHYLGVTGQSPFRYAFLQPPDDEIPRFPGSPDGVRGAPIDSLVRNTDDHTVWINTDGDTAWQLVGSGGSVGGPPTDWVEWTAVLDTGLVDGSNHHVEWEDTVTNATHGTAVTLNGSGDAEVAEDGWYTLDYYVLVDGETTGAVWGDARLRTDITRGFTAGGDHQEDVVSLIEFLPNVGGFAQANMPFSWTGYLLAGDTVEVHARMQTSSVGSDTFEIGDGQFRMEKLPM